MRGGCSSTKLEGRYCGGLASEEDDEPLDYWLSAILITSQCEGARLQHHCMLCTAVYMPQARRLGFSFLSKRGCLRAGA